MKLTLNKEFDLYHDNRNIYCDSLQIAETFNKRHSDVLNTIAKYTHSNSGLSKEFTERNFSLSYYKDASGKRNKRYLLTREGFTIVTLGYTTKKAMQFKEAYINRFNEMETHIKTLNTARLEFPDLTLAIQQVYPDPKPHHYMNEAEMINRIVLGMTSKKFKEANNALADTALRECLNTEQTEAIVSLRRADIGLLLSGFDFQTRKMVLVNYYNRIMLVKVA